MTSSKRHRRVSCDPKSQNKNLNSLKDELSIIFGYLKTKDICSGILLCSYYYNNYFDGKDKENLCQRIISYDFGKFKLLKYQQKYNKFNFFVEFKKLKGKELFKKSFNFDKEWNQIFVDDLNRSFIYEKKSIFLLT